MADPRRAKGTGAGFVYEELRREILCLQLEPGATLEEQGLVARFGLSRTPIREAIIRLAADGLVSMLPNRGAQVASLQLTDFPRFVEALDLVQRAVLRLAALRRTEDDLAAIGEANAVFEVAVAEKDALAITERNRDFHLAIGMAAQNGYLLTNYQRLLDEGMRLLRVPFAYDPEGGVGAQDHIGMVFDEHRAMLQAITEGDADRAEALGRAHCETFHRRFSTYLNLNDVAGIAVAGK